MNILRQLSRWPETLFTVSWTHFCVHFPQYKLDDTTTKRSPILCKKKVQFWGCRCPLSLSATGVQFTWPKNRLKNRLRIRPILNFDSRTCLNYLFLDFFSIGNLKLLLRRFLNRVFGHVNWTPVCTANSQRAIVCKNSPETRCWHPCRRQATSRRLGDAATFTVYDAALKKFFSAENVLR